MTQRKLHRRSQSSTKTTGRGLRSYAGYVRRKVSVKVPTVSVRSSPCVRMHKTLESIKIASITLLHNASMANIDYLRDPTSRLFARLFFPRQEEEQLSGRRVTSTANGRILEEFELVFSAGTRKQELLQGLPREARRGRLGGEAPQGYACSTMAATVGLRADFECCSVFLPCWVVLMCWLFRSSQERSHDPVG